MDAAKSWNLIVEQYSNLYNSSEDRIQAIWEEYCSELLGYKRLYGEIESQISMQIGSSERIIPDIILKKDGLEVFDIELKQYNLPFSDRFETQLISYLNQLHISVGMIVCKKIYLYSYDYASNKNKRLAIPFEKDNENGIRLIELLSKENLESEAIKRFVFDKDKKAKNIQEIKDSLNSDLIKQLLKEHYQQNYTDDEIDEALINVNISISSKEYYKKEDNTSVISMKAIKPKFTDERQPFIEVADKWCKEKASLGLINYDENNNGKLIARFGTVRMDSYLPADDNRNVDWKNRDYFYEIDFRDNRMKMNVVFKNRHNDKINKIKNVIASESREITNPNWEWKWCWKSFSVKYNDLTDEETIINYLNQQFDQVMYKEKSFFDK